MKLTLLSISTVLGVDLSAPRAKEPKGKMLVEVSDDWFCSSGIEMPLSGWEWKTCRDYVSEMSCNGNGMNVPPDFYSDSRNSDGTDASGCRECGCTSNCHDSLWTDKYGSSCLGWSISVCNGNKQSSAQMMENYLTWSG